MAKRFFIQVKLFHSRREGDGPSEPGITVDGRATVPRSLESPIDIARGVSFA